MPISPGGWKEVFKDSDKPGPRKPFSKKTMMEIYVGRRRIQLNVLRNTLSHHDFHRLYKWVNAFTKDNM